MRISDLVGQKLGRYQVQEQIGRGGMAAVFRATDTALQRQVALKVLLPQFTVEEAAVERFRREAITVASLEHPHIVPVYDVGESDDNVFLAMKLLPGATLQDELTMSGTLPLERANEIIGQLAGALDYAHKQGVIHRDIKPANVMLDTEGRAVLSDFGIARAAGSSDLTTTGVIVGTPDYMAPEQIDRQLAPIDARTDVYALGVLTYRALTGERLFEGSATEVIMGHLHQQPRPPSTLNPRLPHGLDAVLLRALAKRPEERFASAGAFAAALRDAAGSVTAAAAVSAALPDVVRSAKPDTLHTAATIRNQRQQPQQQRPSRWPLLLGLVVVGLLACAGLVALGNDRGWFVASAPTATSRPTRELGPTRTRPPASPTSEPTATLTETPGPSPTQTTSPVPTAEREPLPSPSPTNRPTEIAIVPTIPVAQPTARPSATPTTRPTDPPPPPTLTFTPEPTPCNLALLAGGFGLLWNNNAAVRAAVGCPITGEAGGEAVTQYYPNGVLYWWQSSDTIYVFYGHAGGTWQAYAPEQLLNTEPTYSCDGRGYQPVRGFARLLGTFPGIATALGECGTTPEESAGGARQSFLYGSMFFMGTSPSIPEQRIWVLGNDGSFSRHRDPNQ